MTDADTINYRTAQLAKAAPRGTFHPNLVLSGPDGKTNHLPITPAEYQRLFTMLTTDPGITYAVQSHGITTLTAPMWDACGIECPVMIGADCPGKADLASVMDCPGWSAKFPHAAAEVVHGWSLDSQPEVVGDSEQPIGWNALFRAGVGDDPEGPMGFGLILHEDSQGFVSLTRYTTAFELDQDWASLQKQEAAYFRETCEDCTPDTPCTDHTDD